MAKKKKETEDGQQTKAPYVLSEDCILLPRRYYLKDKKIWVGVGGGITTNKGTFIREANEKEYLYIAAYSSHVTIV